MPSPCHFENLIRHLARGAIGIQANKAGYPSHPLALVGRIAAGRVRLTGEVTQLAGELAKHPRLQSIIPHIPIRTIGVKTRIAEALVARGLGPVFLR